MKNVKLFEEYSKNWLVADKVYTDDIYNDELQHFIKYYGYEDTAVDELDFYLSDVQNIYYNGGYLYRGVYLDNINELDKNNLGYHWTLSEYDVRYILDNITFRDSYSDGNKDYFIIKIYTPPKNISIKNVDLKGNPNEKEVNIINDKIIEIKEIIKG